MVERIKAVQKAFWALVGVGVLVLILALPRGGDRDALVVLQELEAFSSSFDRGQLEQTLLAHAKAQGAIGLERVAAAVRGKGLPKVSALPSAEPLAPRASVSLRTLAQVHALTAAGATVPLGLADPEGLGRSLGWRLSRQPERAFELSAIALTKDGCSEAALAREPEVEAARAAARDAADALAAAEREHTRAEELAEQRRKWKASWKMILKANEQRQEALAEKQTAEKAKAQADARYEQLATTEPAAGEPSERCVLASVKASAQPGGRVLELRVPASIELRPVPVGQITGAGFAEAHARGAWEELKDLSPEQATARVRDKFSWHYRFAEVSGTRVGGMTVLQLLPLSLVPCLVLIRRRSRGVGASYNPFDRPTGIDLPSVGLGSAVLNALVLVGLPLAGSVLCAYALLALTQIPVVPLLCAIVCVLLGLQSQLALRDLLELREAVTRSHSQPPPAPSAPVG